VALEFLDGACLVGRLDLGERRVGQDDIAAALELLGALQRGDLDLAADVLGALAPLQLDRVKAVLVHDVLGHSQAGVFHVHLDEDLAVAFGVALVGLDPAVHLGGFLHEAVGPALEPRVDTADVLAADDRNAGNGGARGEVLPVLPGDFRGAQRTREDGEFHLDLLRPAVLGLRVDIGEQGRVGPGLHALGQAMSADGVALDAQVGVVQGIVLVGTGGHVAEFRGIEHLAAPERREPDLAAAPAAVHAARADARHGDHAPRAVKGPCRLVRIGLPQVHMLVLLLPPAELKKGVQSLALDAFIQKVTVPLPELQKRVKHFHRRPGR